MTAGLLGRLPLARWRGRMIQIKTPHEIELMRAAGLVVAGRSPPSGPRSVRG